MCFLHKRANMKKLSVKKNTIIHFIREFLIENIQHEYLNLLFYF